MPKNVEVTRIFTFKALMELARKKYAANLTTNFFVLH